MTNCLVQDFLINTLNLELDELKICSIFNHPKESRFSIFFRSIKSKKKKKTMRVNPKNIMLGLDKRTSIIIKNLPENITQEQFKQIVLKFNPYIDYYFVPNNIKTRKKLRVAFVNVLNYLQIVPLYMGMIYKTKFVYNSPEIEMEICYSKVQGKDELIKRFLSN